MGDKDSSKTRVQPVFDQLLKGDCTGEGWLPRLLQLPQRFDAVAVPIPDPPGRLMTCAWHPKERTMRPPIALLRHLVEREPPDWPAECRPRATAGIPERERLLAGDTETRREALMLLSKEGAPERAWYVLEGVDPR